MRWNRVGVLMGGLSAEREVSISSGDAVADGLERSGYDVVRIDVTRQLDNQLREAAVEAVFVALHGRWGEDGTVQGLLELLGIPYTGSSVLASAVAMDKVQSRALLTAAGLPVAPAMVADKTTAPGDLAELELPVVVKPANEGSSVGVSIVRDAAELGTAIRAALACSSRVLVERFVSGSEINVAILDGEVLGSVEIVPHREFYDYSAKYDDGGSTHHVPPRIAADRVAEAERHAVRAYEVIGCTSAVRVDLIVPENDPMVILELNTIPGMTPTSLLPEIAAASGLSFEQLVARMIEGARLHIGGPNT
jgi:D-alanine-D-alanine ligase